MRERERETEREVNVSCSGSGTDSSSCSRLWRTEGQERLNARRACLPGEIECQYYCDQFVVVSKLAHIVAK